MIYIQVNKYELILTVGYCHMNGPLGNQVIKKDISPQIKVRDT